jgi:hypothetical protein
VAIDETRVLTARPARRIVTPSDGMTRQLSTAREQSDLGLGDPPGGRRGLVAGMTSTRAAMPAWAPL